MSLVTLGFGTGALASLGFNGSFALSSTPTITFRQALTTALEGNTTISSLNAGIYPVHVPEDGTLPAVLYKINQTDRFHDLDGVTGVCVSHVTFATGSTDFTLAESLAKAIYNQFDGNTTALVGIVQLETKSGDEADEAEPPIDASDQWIYWIVIPYTFMYVEPSPTG